MEEPRPEVLVVDDERNVLKTMGLCFDALGFRSTLCGRPQDALAELDERAFDLAFVDLKMSPIDGMTVLRDIKRRAPETTVVIVTAHGSIESAVEAVKLGAYDYIQKPFDLDQLEFLVQKAWEHHRLAAEVRQLRSALSRREGAGDIVTRSRAMLDRIDLALQVADSTMSVLIEGESGTGKELLARAIHAGSVRAARPFVKVNCAALPEQLLESELFGHVKGAFTGAVRDRKGRFELAAGGTIFLDEIAELSPGIQAKLLRVLQNGEFEAVGESEARTIDVRVIAATNRDLDAALQEGTFRDDLFYRLNAVRIKLPPLRERPEDIPLLIEHFISVFVPGGRMEVDDDARRALSAYRWSGNVRELEHVIQRAVLLAREGPIRIEHLPEEIRTTTERPSHALSLEEIERAHIVRVLQHAHDYDEAARILGIDPATLWRKRKKYGL